MDGVIHRCHVRVTQQLLQIGEDGIGGVQHTQQTV